MTLLSACILLRHDVEPLRACLESLRGRVDEIVVVHTGTAPDLDALPADLPLVFESWRGDEGALRRAAVAHTSGDRVLVLDARERLVVLDEAGWEIARASSPGVLLPVVEADRAEPDLQAVVAGEGRLSEIRLEPRILDRAAAGTWRGVREPRPSLAVQRLPQVEAFIVSTRLIRGTPSPEVEDAAWIRAAVAAPGDAHVLAGAARHLRDRGHRELAGKLAQQAVDAALDGQVDALHAATIAVSLCALDQGDAQTAFAHVAAARGRLLSHPDLDLLQALAVIELDKPGLRAGAISALRRALGRSWERFIARPLTGATGDAARLALITLLLAQGDVAQAVRAQQALSPLAQRSLPAVLLAAELAIVRDQPATALRLLVDRLGHAGADGWILAAEAAGMIGHVEDRDAFMDRADAHLGAGLLAPHRRRRLLRLRARLAALAVLRHLAGSATPLPAVGDPLDQGEVAARSGDLDLAHALFVERLRRSPDDVVAWTNLGVVLHEAGVTDAAALALRVAVELEPEDADLRLQLAVISWTGGHLADAASQAREALKRAELVDARALLAALDLDGGRAPTVALLGDADADLVRQVRLARARPCVAEPQLVEALGGLEAWLRAVRPDVLLIHGGQVTLVASWVHEHPERVVFAEDGFAALATSLDVARAEERPTRELARPLLSVVVPTRDRLASVVTLLDRIGLQDLPPDLLEVIVVDDGSALPIERSDLGARPFRLTLLRQGARGPAAARNSGIEAAQADIVWLLDDDARPAPDAARLHLVGHTHSDSSVALVGGFRLLERHRQTVWDHLLDTTPLHLGPAPVPRGGELSWRSFAVANTSLRRADVLDAGGFDGEAFPEPGHEDAELGLRLSGMDVALVHRPDIHAGHDHRMGLDAWLERARALGRAQVALRDRHPERDDVLKLGTDGAPVGPVLDALRTVLQAREPRIAEATAALRRLAGTPLPRDPEARAEILVQTQRMAELVGDHAHQRGLIDARMGAEAAHSDPRLGATSVVLFHRADAIASNDLLDQLIEGLRHSTAGPLELIIAHRGALGLSMAARQDLVTVEVPGDEGAIEAWNRGLARATGETVLLCDDDILFTPAWRERLLEHAVRWPDIGLVAALGARSRSDLDDASVRFASDHAGEHAWPVRVQLPRTLVRRELLERIGGLDPRMGALAGHDWALRARRAGFRVRLAGDVLLGAVDRAEPPTPDNVRAFRERHGVDPLERRALLAAAEQAYDPARDSLPLQGLDAPTVLLDPAGRATAARRSRGKAELGLDPVAVS